MKTLYHIIISLSIIFLFVFDHPIILTIQFVNAKINGIVPTDKIVDVLTNLAPNFESDLYISANITVFVAQGIADITTQRYIKITSSFKTTQTSKVITGSINNFIIK